MRRAFGGIACAAAVCAVLSAPALAAPANGQLAAVADERIVTFNPDGSGLRVLWTPAVRGDLLSGPAWSPDGNRLAFVHAGRIMVFDLPQARLIAATNPPDGARDTDPGWSADGTRIGFRRIGALAQGAIRVGIDGSDLQRVALNPATSELAWSPNLQRVALVVGSLLILPGLDLTLATDVNGPVAWSPDGDRIAFTDAGGLAAVTAGAGAPVRIADAPARAPRWSPDGRALVYRTPSGLRMIAPEGGTSHALLPGSGVGAADWQPCTPGVTVSCESLSPPQCSAVTASATTQTDQPIELPPPPCADPAGRPLDLVVTKPPDHGTLAGRRYTPGPGFTGQDVVIYRVSNGISLSEPVRLTIFVVPRPAAAAPAPAVRPPPVLRAPFLSARATPRLDRRGRTLVRLSCDQDCSMALRLTARLRSKRTVRGPLVRRSLRAGSVLSLRLRLPAKTSSRPKTVWITGTVRGPTGDGRPVKLPVTLRR